MKLWVIPALAALAAAPAQAALTATYSAPGRPPAMKVEVADDGKFRVEMAGGLLAFIHRDGHTYLVTGGGGEAKPMVADLADLRASIRESDQGQASKMCETFASTAGKTKLVRHGTAIVAGRTGDAWFKAEADGTLPPRPELVISRDPALAPLATAFLEEYRASTSMMPDCPVLADMKAEMAAALATGAPLAFGSTELAGIDTRPIDAKRFDLPTAPATAAELRAMTSGKGSGPIVVLPPRN